MSANRRLTAGVRRLAAATAVGALLFFAVGVPAASAQTDPSPDSTTETTLPPDTTETTLPPDTTETTLPPDTTAAPDTTAEPTTTDAPDTTEAPETTAFPTTAAPDDDRCPDDHCGLVADDATRRIAAGASVGQRRGSGAAVRATAVQQQRRPATARPATARPVTATRARRPLAPRRARRRTRQSSTASRTSAPPRAPPATRAATPRSARSPARTQGRPPAARRRRRARAARPPSSEGDANATGVSETNKISQAAFISADDGSQVDIVQVALVINIGFGVANTSGNAATGVSPGHRPAAGSNVAGLCVGHDRERARRRRADDDEDPPSRGRADQDRRRREQRRERAGHQPR